MVEVLANFENFHELIKFFDDTIRIVFFTTKQAFIITKLDKFYVKVLNSDQELILVDELCGQDLSDFSYGLDHVVALSRKGNLFCWGHNRFGQLGNGGRDSSRKPEKLEFSSDAKIIDIKCGGYHTLALTNNGEVYAWGGNQCGQIGKGEVSYEVTPHKLDAFNGEKIKAISCGWKHSLVLTESGRVYGCGDNRDNQLGLEEKSSNNVPKLLKMDYKIVKISCGSHHSLLLSDRGVIYSFGRNNFHQLGTEEKSKSSHIIKFIGFIDIAAHSHYNLSVALSEDNNYHVWGEYQKKDELKFLSIDDVFAHYLKVTLKSIILEDTNSSTINEFSTENSGIDDGKYAKEFDEKSQLTEGSFGTVFEVQSRIEGKIYAIKKIPLKSDVTSQDIKKISDNFLKNLDNDYVVQYYEVWAENIHNIEKDVKLVERSLPAKEVFKYNERPLLFIRMEIYEMTLRQFIDDVRKDSILFSGRTFTKLGYYISSQIFIEILEAVNYLHKNNIIHHNLKPYNIFLKKGSYGRIVRIANSYTHFIRKSVDNSILNFEVETKYIAPEYLDNYLNDEDSDDKDEKEEDNKKNIKDIKELKAKADIYSLGVIFKELLDINVNRPYKNATNETNILVEKYREASEWCLKMKKLRIIERPNISDIINSKNLWAIDENKIDMEEVLKIKNENFKIYPFLKMMIRNSKKKSDFMDRNLSNKLNEYFERKIKLSFVYEKEVIIITKDDSFYKIGLNNLSNLLGLNDGSLMIESALVEQLCGKKIESFACGVQHVIALSGEGEIYCWGRNESGQLGNGIKDFYDNEPQLNKFLSKVNDIKCGSYHSLALKKNKVYSWGKNSSGQIGNGNNEDQLEPIKVNGFEGKKVIAISCGTEHSIALTENGKVFSWGLNDQGQLGNGTMENSNVPCLMVGDIYFEKISCGSKHCILLSNNNDIYAVGNNEFGQLGNDDGINQSTPIIVKYAKKFEKIASHFEYDISVAQSVDNGYYVWGRCGEQNIKTPTKEDLHSFNDVFDRYLKLSYEPKNEFHFDDTFIDNKRYFELFENEEKLGSGSYGTVFKVREKSTKQCFAIKKIAFKPEMKNEQLKQLEISDTIKKLDNKYLVKYFNAWLEEEEDKKRIILYIQMEACETNLLSIIDELDQNSDIKIYDIMTYYVMSELFFELLCGVDYLHKQNIIHRNLNPSNVLIKIGLDKNFVKISGFGLIAFQQFEDQKSDQYRWHLSYAAPELKIDQYDQKTDIYSLGVILQELFLIDFNWEIKKKQFLRPYILEKILKIEEYCDSMTTIIPILRPNCEDLLKERHLWALSEEEYDFEEQFKELSRPDFKFKNSLIYNIFKTKFSSKASIDMKFSEKVEIPVTKAKVAMKGSLYYEMSRNPRGLCVIIDNKSEKPFVESKRFESIFQQLYFDVVKTNSMTAQEISLFLEKLSKEKRNRFTKDDALVVFIISHGTNEKIYGYNSCKDTDENNSRSISEIVNIFSETNCIALRQTPKLFFFNCCRERSSDVLEIEKETSKTSYSEIIVQKMIDDNRDTLISYSCSESCENFQDVSSKISLFGQAFSHSIAKYACEENLQSIISRTWNYLQKATELSNRKLPDLRVKYMRRHLYFNPGH